MATKAGSAEVPQSADAEGLRRRDYLKVGAVAFAGVGGSRDPAPLLVQMAPSADVLALATTEVDISKVQPGQGDQGQLAQAAGVRPQPDAEGDRGGQRGPDVASCAIRSRSPSGPSRASATG